MSISRIFPLTFYAPLALITEIKWFVTKSRDRCWKTGSGSEPG